jgi:glycosyltransferase involved in cell wall biosynthesis
MFLKAYYIKKFSKKYNIDVVISSMEDSDIPNILSKLIFKNKAKVFVWVHNSKRYLGEISNFFYKFADKVITIVNEERDKLAKKLRHRNIITIYNSINSKRIIQQTSDNLGEYKKLFKNNKFTFINIGRLTYQKNQKFLIKAFKKFNQKYPDTQLLILGEGELRQELEKEIGDNKNIHLL